MEYSRPSVCLSVCLCNDNPKYNRSINLKIEHVVVYENSLEEFDIEQFLTKVKVMV